MRRMNDICKLKKEDFISCYFFRNQFGQVMESEYWIGVNILDRSKGLLLPV